jgi:hypothetical protein
MVKAELYADRVIGPGKSLKVRLANDPATAFDH